MTHRNGTTVDAGNVNGRQVNTGFVTDPNASGQFVSRVDAVGPVDENAAARIEDYDEDGWHLTVATATVEWLREHPAQSDVHRMPVARLADVVRSVPRHVVAEWSADHPAVWCWQEHLRREAGVHAQDVESMRAHFEALTGGWQFEMSAAATAATHEDGVQKKLAGLRETAEAKRRFEIEIAAANPAPPFDDGLLGDILARPPLPADRIENILPWDASLLVIAQRKAGKTTLMLNIARSLITGEKFLGQFPTIPVTGRVAFMNYEVNAAQIARWADETGIDPDRLYVVNLRGRRNPLSVPDDRAELVRRMRAHNVESVIVDPFGRAYTGSSQNDAGEVTEFLVDLDGFVRSEVGARDLVLAVHAGWDGERARGSSALEDWGDSFVNLTVNEQDQRFFRAKGRDVELDEDLLEYDAVTRRLSLSGTGGRRDHKTVAKVHDLEEPLTRIIQGNDGLSVSGIREALRAQKVPFQDGDVSTALKALATRKRITRTSGGPGKPTTHHIRNDTGETNPFGPGAVTEAPIEPPPPDAAPFNTPAGTPNS